MEAPTTLWCVLPRKPPLSARLRETKLRERYNFQKTSASPATSKAMSVAFGKQERSFYKTLVSKDDPPPPPRVWGAAYRIPPEHVVEVQSYLDIREINGYSIQYTSFQPAIPEVGPIDHCMVYIGLPSNPQFMGRQDPDQLARHIWKSKGPSGENKEYLFMLEDALKGLGEGAGDEHVQDLATRVRGVGGQEVAETALDIELERVRSGKSHSEQEETEK
ncbi:MAG: hypothetical protein LQ351_000610 [Letrouitia transgressa]|nr:MAG: hypothetical protein LQ351_000610 [Letrouitia transgressa]